MSSELNIQANEDTVKSVLTRGSYRFRVPEYQRQYAWEEPQLEDLWLDLEQLVESDGTHFLGSVVVVQEETRMGDLNIMEVVDGQQRLVTISLLLCLIRNKLREIDEDEWDMELDPQARAEEIETDYLYKKDEQMRKHPNLTLSTFDNDDYQDVLNNRHPNDEESQLIEAVEYYSEKLSEVSHEDVEIMRRHLVNSMTLVTIRCNSEESAFKLFETLNDRGLDLTAVDLMKNHLFSVATQSPQDVIDYEQIKTDWEEIIRVIKPELTKPGRFFRHYMMAAREPDIPEAITSYTLYDRFCQLVDEGIPESDTTVQDYIRDVKDKSPLYVDIVNSDTDLFTGRANTTINRYLRNLNILGASQERTLLFRLFIELDNSNELIRGLSAIESFIFRWRVTNQTTGTGVDDIHAKLCSEIFDTSNPVDELIQKLESKAPSDSEVRVAIMTNDFPRNERTRYILSKIEMDAYSRDHSKVVDSTTIEIEHIAPRKSFTANKYVSWGDYLDCGKETFDEYCNKIGNLTLLNERMNARAQAKPFEQKKREYESSEFVMTQEVCDIDNWSTGAIETRTKELAEKAPQIWNFDI